MNAELLISSVRQHEQTERAEQAEQTLLETQRLLGEKSRLFDITLSSITDFAYTFDKEGRFLYANRPLVDLLGIKPDDIVGKNFFDLSYPHDLATRLQRQIQHVFDTKETVRDETPFTSETGAGGFYEYIFSPVTGADGSVDQVAGSTRDITERKQAEAALRDSEERFATAFRASPQAISITSLKTGKLTEINETFINMTGYGYSEAIGRSTDELGLWKSSKDRDAELADVRSEASIRNREYQFRLRDGSEITGLLSAELIEIGGELCALTVIQDITERKRNEEQIQRSGKTFFNLIQNAPFGVYLVNSEFLLVEVSGAASKVFSGVYPLLNRDFAEVLNIVWPEPFVSEALGRFRHTLATGEEYHSADTTEQRNDIDDTESYDWLLRRITLPDGTFGVVCYFWDMTDRKRAEKALRSSEKLSRLALDSAELGTFNIDPETLVLTGTDERFRAIFGIAEGQSSYEGAFAAVHPDDREQQRIEVAAAIQPDNPVPYNTEYRVIHPDGSIHWVSAKARAHFSDDGLVRKPLSFDGTVADITERKQREANLAFLADIGQDLARITTVKETMQTIGAKMGAYLGLSLCTFIEIDEAEDHATVNYNWHREDVPSAVGVHRLSDFITGEFQAAGRAGETFIIRDTATDERATAESFAAFKIGSMVTVPIIKDGKWQFLLCVYRSEASNWREDEIALTQELTTRIFTRLESSRAVEELHKSEENFRTLANSMSQMAWMTHADGHIFWYNQRWFDYTGTTLEKMQGWGWQAVHHPSAMERVTEKFKQHLSSGQIWEDTFLLRSAAGVYRWFLSRAVPIRNDKGDIVRWFGTNTDVDDVRRAEDILALSRDELEMRVETRTGELRDANAALKVQVVERHKSQEERITLLKKVLTAQEDERSRIARDLHDELGQQVTALRLKLENAKEICSEEPVCDEIDGIQSIAKRLDADIGFLAWELRPAMLQEAGLPSTLRDYVNEWSRFASVKSELREQGFGKARLEPDVEINLYRIVQEALNNVNKHADAANVSILIEKRNDHISLIIEDDGKGFDPDRKRKGSDGLGLLGMRERVNLLRGTVEIESSRGNGTTVFVRVPTAKKPESKPGSQN